MNGPAQSVSLASKQPASPRPPAVGEEVRGFHEIYRFSELPRNYSKKMEGHDSVYNDKSETSTLKTLVVSETVNATDVSPNPSPPPYKWAQSLQCLLEDIQGVSLFEQFLKQEGHETRSLSFWFACRGVKKTDPSDREKLYKLINVLYEKKVKRIPTISAATKNEIKQKLFSHVGVDVNIFDAAQAEVEAYMLKTTYPNFLKSDLFILHLGVTHNAPVSEGECLVSPEAGDFLPTVHEDSELNISVNKIQYIKQTMYAKRRMSAKARPEGQVGLCLKSPYSYSSYHTKYASFLPASAQDSERQSMSSDVQTDDTMSQTDSSVDYPMHKSKQKRHEKTRYPGIINTDKLCTIDFIPRTQGPLGPKSIMPKNPEEFHAVLVKKLCKVAEEQKNKDKMNERLNSIEEAFTSQKGPIKPLDPATFFQYAPIEDNVQDILDQHVSRVFEDTGLTPRMSPVCATPPNAKPLCEDHSRVLPPSHIAVDSMPQDLVCSNLSRIGQPSPFSVPYAGRIRRDQDTRSNDSGALTDCWISEDNLPQCHRNSESENVPYDYSARRTREKIKYMNKKLSSMTDSSSSCFDSGISVACESVQPSHSKVSHWLEAKRCASEPEKDHQWKSSTSPVLSRSSSSRKVVVYSNSRPGVLESGSPHWPLLPAQPLAQDPSMPALPPPDTTTNLIEARRRLEDESRSKIVKSKYVSSGRTSHDTSRGKVSSRACDLIEDGISHRKQSKKSMDCGASSVASSDMTVIGYSFGRGSVPYKSRLPGKNITLRQFKSLLNKKGNFRYFFKRVSDDFGTGVVLEEVSDDYEILPLWEGKIFCVIESMDDGTNMNDD